MNTKPFFVRAEWDGEAGVWVTTRGNSKEIPLPPQYAGWEHVLLDIDPRSNLDVVCDARELSVMQLHKTRDIHAK